jgi:hypothetical protein
MKNKTKIIGAAFAIILIGTLPMVIQLRKISRTMHEFSIDEKVSREASSHPNTKPTAQEFLNPPFQKRYGLDMDQYLDKKGFFAPNGIHWAGWNIETKTAALMMWKADSFPSAWSVRQTIRQIDEFYSRASKETSVVDVLNAVTSGRSH